MSKLQTFRVSFSEWTVYQKTVEAASPVDAARQVYQQFIHEGPEELEFGENGTEAWSVRAKGGALTQVTDAELLDL